MNKIDYLEKCLSRQLHWIQSADARIALILPVATAMLGALSILMPVAEKWCISSAIFSSFTIFFLVLSIIFTAIASFPRTNGPKGSLIYFSGINNKETSQYKQAITQLDEENYMNDLVSQCHVNAQIAHNKFTWVKRAMSCLFISSLPWAVSIFLLYNLR